MRGNNEPNDRKLALKNAERCSSEKRKEIILKENLYTQEWMSEEEQNW